jgi:hypothetical protein
MAQKARLSAIVDGIVAKLSTASVTSDLFESAEHGLLIMYTGAGPQYVLQTRIGNLSDHSFRLSSPESCVTDVHTVIAVTSVRENVN